MFSVRITAIFPDAPRARFFRKSFAPRTLISEAVRHFRQTVPSTRRKFRRSFPGKRLPRPTSSAETVTVKNGPLCPADSLHVLFGLTFSPLRSKGGESQPLSPLFVFDFHAPSMLSAEPKLFVRPLFLHRRAAPRALVIPSREKCAESVRA